RFLFLRMSRELTQQELHNLAINIVDREHEAQDIEFMEVNRATGKKPQFVCLRAKALHFIAACAEAFPEDPTAYDPKLLKRVKEHSQKFEAGCFYAGVGLYNAGNRELPVELDQEYLVDYQGLIEV